MIKFNPKLGKPIVLIGIGSHSIIHDPKCGKLLLEFLRAEFPMIYPEYVDFVEPVKLPINDNNLDENFSKCWSSSMSLWLRKSKIRSYAQWFQFHPKQFPDGMETFYLTLDFDNRLDYKVLLKGLMEVLNADYGSLLIESVVKETDCQLARAKDSQHSSLPVILTYSRPMRNLPPISIMSERYIEAKFGNSTYKDLLEGAAPDGVEISTVKDRWLMINLIEDISEIENDFGAFERRRKQMKTLLGDEAFEEYSATQKTMSPKDFQGSVVGIVES